VAFERWQMRICRNKKTWTGTNTFTRIEASRIEGGRVSCGGNDISELHRQNNVPVKVSGWFLMLFVDRVAILSGWSYPVYLNQNKVLQKCRHIFIK
jgi:hypothetical protein